MHQHALKPLQCIKKRSCYNCLQWFVIWKCYCWVSLSILGYILPLLPVLALVGFCLHLQMFLFLFNCSPNCMTPCSFCFFFKCITLYNQLFYSLVAFDDKCVCDRPLQSLRLFRTCSVPLHRSFLFTGAEASLQLPDINQEVYHPEKCSIPVISVDCLSIAGIQPQSFHWNHM